MTVFVQIDDQRIELKGDDAAQELARIERLSEKFANEQQIIADRAQDRQSARTKLSALGLTDAEIAALLGA